MELIENQKIDAPNNTEKRIAKVVANKIKIPFMPSKRRTLLVEM